MIRLARTALIALAFATPAMAEICDKVGSAIIAPGPGVLNALAQPVRDITSIYGLGILGLAAAASWTRSRWLAVVAAVPPALLLCLLLWPRPDSAEFERMAIIEGCLGPDHLTIALLLVLIVALARLAVARKPATAPP